MDPEMITAIRSGDGKQIIKLYEEKVQLFSNRSPQGNTVLHIAVRYGNLSVVRGILSFQGSFLFDTNSKGETPLHLAVVSGNIDVFCVLLDYKDWRNLETGEPNILRIPDDEGNIPLHIAAKNNRRFMAERMLRYDPSLVSCVNNSRRSPLSVAIDSSDFYCAYMIIYRGPKDFDHHGEDLIKLLRALILKKENEFYRALSRVKGVNFMDVDEKGRNPLHYAAAAGNDSITKELLLTYPSLAYEGDRYGETPLHLAARNGQLSSLKNLINTCPDATEVLDHDKRNILHTAAAYGQVNIVSFLLKMRELEDLINSCDDHGRTPLHLAATNLNIDVINYLLKNEKVKIRATDTENRTALQLVEAFEDSQKTFQKHLTIKALKAAYADQPLEAEDILLDDSRFKGISNIDGNRGHKEMAQTLSVIGTLVATFTFTAAFTIPGGFISDGPDEGLAALARKTAFRTFVVTDTIAMTSSMSAAMLVFWTFWRSGSESFMDTLPLSIGLIWVGLVSMTIAFVTGLFVVLSKDLTLAIVVCCIGCALPLIFYVGAPLSPLLLSKSGLPQTEDNPFAFTLKMVKMLFSKLFAIIWRPFGICREVTK